MSTRAYRKALAKQEKNKSEIGVDVENGEDSFSDEEPKPAQVMSKFSADILDDYFGGADSDSCNENTKLSDNQNDDRELKRSEGVAVVKKKRKKKKKGQVQSAKQNESDKAMGQKEANGVHVELDTDEELEKLIKENEKKQAELSDELADVIKTGLRADARHFAATSQAQVYLSVDARFLLAENEMIRMFGQEVLRGMNKQKRSHKQNQSRSQYKLAKVPDNMPQQIPKVGLSMSMIKHESSDKYIFKYEHSKEYQKAQLAFWSATHGMRHEGLMQLLNHNWFHLDTLIQASNLFRMNDDSQNAGTLIERALCIAESAFHPMFSVTSGKCRLPYKYPENRCLYIAMFHHIHFLTKKGCHRTSLEFCKLILSLAPDEDPLSILLLIDVCALMSKQYKWLINFYSAWNPLKNLYQLPNFAYSVPLAEFLLIESGGSSSDDAVMRKIDKKLEDALISFPSVLPELLNLCNIDADSKTERNRYFGMSSDVNQLPIVTQMCKLYAHRIYHIWKQPEVMKWLERCTKVAIERVNSKDPMVEKSKNDRKTLYKGTPRNVYRHFILSDVKEVPANLPNELQSASLYSYDPLPPPDTELTYERPPSPHGRSRYPAGRNLLSTFLEALMPLYGVEQEALNQAGVRGFEMQNPIEVVGEQRIPPGAENGNPGDDVAAPGDGNGNPQNAAEGGRPFEDLRLPEGANRENLLAMLRDWMRQGGPAEMNNEVQDGPDNVHEEAERLAQMQLDENLALALAAQSEGENDSQGGFETGSDS